MKSYINSEKTKSLKYVVIIFLTIILTLTGYILSPNDVSFENTPTNNIQKFDVPEYSGQIVISINNNVPYFEDEDITTKEFEDYSHFDECE